MAAFCIPPVIGIPGFETTKLNWYDLGADTRPHQNFPEDPNWLGCFSLGSGNGTQNQVEFRALSGVDGNQQYLYLSWIVRVQPNPPAINFDGLNLLIGTGTNYIFVRVRLSTSAETKNGDKTVAYAMTTHPSNGVAVGGAHSPAAPWATGTGRAWIVYPSPISTVSATIPWAFQIRVPLGAELSPAGAPMNESVTLPVGASFKLWYQLNVTVAGMVVPYTWPGTPFSTSEVVPIPAGLTPADVALPGVAGGCVTGIALAGSQIAIEDVTTAAVRVGIQLDLDPITAAHPVPDVSQPQHQNVFFARPTGVTVAAEPTLRATFRLANWGTQFTTPPPNSTAWRTVPGGEQVTYQGPIPAPSPFATSEFRFTWPKPPLDTFTTNFIAGVRLFNSSGGVSGQNSHQCMLVEMRSGDSSVVFTRSSAFKNLWAVNASTYRDVAEVSVVDNPPIGTQPREVYLYLQTMGLPRVVDDAYRDRMGQSLRGDLRSPVAATYGRTLPLLGDIFDHAPTYQVHAYYDSGKTMQREDGSRVKILLPQTSFGYIVAHDGALAGWESRLYGAEKIAENLYIVRVPNNGSVRVRPAIQARESASEQPLPVEEGGGRCSRLADWLDSKGFIGRLLAWVVRVVCRLFGG